MEDVWWEGFGYGDWCFSKEPLGFVANDDPVDALSLSTGLLNSLAYGKLRSHHDYTAAPLWGRAIHTIADLKQQNWQALEVRYNVGKTRINELRVALKKAGITLPERGEGWPGG